MIVSLKLPLIMTTLLGLFGFTEYGTDETQRMAPYESDDNNCIHVGRDALLSDHDFWPIIKVIEFTEIPISKRVTSAISGRVAQAWDTMEQFTMTKTHGWNFTTTAMIIASMIVCFIAFRYIVRAAMIKYGAKTPGITSWNLISALMSLVVSGFGFLMSKNVILTFVGEIYNRTGMCEMISFVFGSFFGILPQCHDPLLTTANEFMQSSNFPYTAQMVNDMDYEIHSSQVALACMLLTSYFACDMLTNKVTSVMIFHHSMGLFWVMYYYVTQTYTFYVAALFTTEFSTIFLAMSQFFPKNSSLKTITLLEFAIAFFLTRIVFVPILMDIAYCVEPRDRLWAPIGSMVGLMLLNSYWFVLIARKVKERFKSRHKLD